MASSSQKVDLIVIGAMKCGTTALHSYLAQLNEFTPSTLKETDFFKSPKTVSRGEDWYHGLFTSGSEYWCETSPNYSKRHAFEGVADRIRSYNPNCKFIYIVRSPVDRIVSHYLHNRYQGREELGFSDAIRNDDNYILTTKYHYQLEPFVKQFGKDSILLLDYEELRSSPELTLSKICEFISPEQKIEFSITPLEAHITANKFQNNKLGTFISNIVGNSSIKQFLVKLPLPLNLFKSKRKISVPAVSTQDKEFIYSSLKNDIATLNNEYGVRL